jgi:hypothetical protein
MSYRVQFDGDGFTHFDAEVEAPTIEAAIEAANKAWGYEVEVGEEYLITRPPVLVRVTNYVTPTEGSMELEYVAEEE